MELNRRNLLTGAVANLFMPAVVKAEILMPVKSVFWEPPVIYKSIPDFWGYSWDWRKNNGKWEKRMTGWDYNDCPLKSQYPVPPPVTRVQEYIDMNIWSPVGEWCAPERTMVRHASKLIL